METLATLVLAFFALVVMVNLANGTLRSWLAAKFLHREPASSQGASS